MSSEKEENNFLIIDINEDRNRVEVHIRGVIDEPKTITNEIRTLYKLVETYPTILIYFNSPGGYTDTVVELLSIIKMFDLVITVASGTCASGAFMLWAAGDIKVIQDYTSMMIHRESYGYEGKTDQHSELAEINNKLFKYLLLDLCSNILTEEEHEKIKYTELYFSPETLIERGAAITWDSFIESEEQVIKSIPVLVFPDGNQYVTEDGFYYNKVKKLDIDNKKMHTLPELFYKVFN